jgi:hypothetical protein
METSTKSRPPESEWPFDLRVFATMSALWAICLQIRAFVHPLEFAVLDPVEVVLGGVRFAGDDARIVLIVESGIFAMIAIGVFTQQRWGLLLALCTMVEVVMSHLAFTIAYLPIRQEWMNVRAAAMEGPMMVMITLYLWIRATDLIFDSPTRSPHAPRIRVSQDHKSLRKPMRTNSVIAGFEK